MTYIDLAAVVIVTGAMLWAFHFYFTRPGPPPLDEPRFLKLEHELKDASKAIDSLKNAVGIRQLR